MDTNIPALITAPSEFEAIIRPATAEDLPKLEWFGRYWHYREIFRRTFEEQKRGRRLMLVADVDGFPVGQVFIQFESVEKRYADGTQRAYLYSLRVMEEFRGHGLGTRLIERAEEAIVERGYRWATIAVAQDNAGALKLYQRLGYDIFAADPGQWSFVDPAGIRHQINEPAWLMQKQLA